ncbi:MAG: YbfB/YjiJ family MFS transporter [Vulcanimicrobiaceae bacterium]
MDNAEGRAPARSEPGLAFIAAAVALAVAMGVGRFVYTPLLVVMLKEGSLSRAFAGVLAAANLAGYLLGALMAMHSLASRRRTMLVRLGSVVVVVMTAMMALPSSVWLPARFITWKRHRAFDPVAASYF